MKKIENLWARAADALQGKPTVEEIDKLRQEIGARLVEIERRVKTIQHDGTERADVMATGSPQELVNLDAELKELQAEERQLRYRISELHRQRSTVEAENGIRDSDMNREAFTKAVQRAQEAAQTYFEARDSARVIGEKIAAARIAGRSEGLEFRLCYAETGDLTALADLLFEGPTLDTKERRFAWANGKALNAKEVKMVALGDGGAPEGANMRIRNIWKAA